MKSLHKTGAARRVAFQMISDRPPPAISITGTAVRASTAGKQITTTSVTKDTPARKRRKSFIFITPKQTRGRVTRTVCEVG